MPRNRPSTTKAARSELGYILEFVCWEFVLLTHSSSKGGLFGFHEFMISWSNEAEVVGFFDSTVLNEAVLRISLNLLEDGCAVDRDRSWKELMSHLRYVKRFRAWNSWDLNFCTPGSKTRGWLYWSKERQTDDIIRSADRFSLLPFRSMTLNQSRLRKKARGEKPFQTLPYKSPPIPHTIVSPSSENHLHLHSHLDPSSLGSCWPLTYHHLNTLTNTSPHHHHHHHARWERCQESSSISIWAPHLLCPHWVLHHRHLGQRLQSQRQLSKR